MFLTVLRGLRIFLAAFLRRPGVAPGRHPREAARVRDGEMVRDPVCGTWVDRRLAVPARRAGEIVPVCSEACRASVEALEARGGSGSGPEARAR
jgi:hypothetical protein